MKKKILSLFSVLLIMFFAISNVYALEVSEAGENITEEGTYESLRFVAGNKVISKATIDGIAFAAGNIVTFEGNVTYGMYAGNMVTISGNIEKDLLVAGNEVIITDNTTIGRDTYVAGNKITIKTNIPRDLRAGGSSIDLSGVPINGDAYLLAEKIIFDENTVINGTLTYYEDSQIIGLDEATIGNKIAKKAQQINVEYGFKERAYAFVVSVIAAFITMVCLLNFIPKAKDKLDKLDLHFGYIAKTACIGFCVLFIVPIVAILAMITGFLTPLALIVLALYFIAVYLGTLFTAYVIGNVIANKLFKKDNMYLALAIGIVLIRLLSIVPIIGGYILALSLFYGLGLIYDFLKKSKEK